jgi:hypothetical protein
MNLEIVKPFQNRPKTSDFLIDTGYLSQLDNWAKYHGSGSRQCRLTSYCNAIDYVLNGDLKRQALARGYEEAEDLYGEALRTRFGGDTTEAEPNTLCAAYFGVEGYFTTTASENDVATCLYLGVPVPIGVRYKTSGHWITAVGRDKDGFSIDDPYGTRLGTSDSYNIGKGGNNDHVSWSWLKSCFTDLGDESGYAFLITKVRGVPTGVKHGL